MLTIYIKRLLYPFYILPRIGRKRRNQLHQLFAFYNKNEIPVENIKPLKIFSSREEDGIILKLIASLNIKKGYFIEIGSNDCINSNCANLVFNFHWDGLFIDADEKLLKIGRRNYTLFGKGRQVNFACSFLTAENINQVLSDYISDRQVDFMSIDIDGDDYAIWRSIEYVRPSIVVIENKIEYGGDDIVVPAHKPFAASEWGASIVSINKLAERKGYTLVATNAEGFNAFFMRDDKLKESRLKPLSLNDVLSDKAINKSFYDESVMKSLYERLESIT